MVVATCLYPGVNNEPERNRRMEKCKAELQHALKLDPTLVEAYYFLGLAHQYQRRYKEADVAYEKAKSIAVKQKLSARAIYIARWAMFPLENTTLDLTSQCAEAERRAKELVGAPVPPGASLDPRKDIVYIQAEIQNRQGKIVEAKQICDEALKNLSTADRSDVNLLLARSRYEIQLANSRKSLEDAKAAIADAERAAQAALVREVIVEALATAANARFEAYALSPEQQYFNDAVANASEIANKLAPRRPISARLCAMVAVEYGRKFVTLGAGTPAEKFELVNKAIDWQFPSVSWENDRTAQNQLAGELVQLFKAAIPQVNTLRETAPQRLVELRKAVDKWMVMIQKIAEDVPERKEVAAQLDQLKQTLHQ
jgi:tetratricopeptide (TPR) repeat protein